MMMSDAMVITNGDRVDALLLELFGFVAMVVFVIVDGRVSRARR